MKTQRPELFYLQDARQYVGNSVSWWAKDGKGYVCDIRKAHIFTRDDIERGVTDRSTDVAWPKELIDGLIQHHIDFQGLRGHKPIRQHEKKLEAATKG